MLQLTWSDWIDLDADLSSYHQHLAATAGFYRIERRDFAASALRRVKPERVRRQSSQGERLRRIA